MIEPKERPGCRKAILKLGLRPLTVEGEWDGSRSVDETGERGSLSDGLRKQMRRMIAEGHWSGVKLPARTRRTRRRIGAW
jgi:hypothetical protein